jgi:hypothetical protein
MIEGPEIGLLQVKRQSFRIVLKCAFRNTVNKIRQRTSRSKQTQVVESSDISPEGESRFLSIEARHVPESISVCVAGFLKIVTAIREKVELRNHEGEKHIILYRCEPQRESFWKKLPLSSIQGVP